MPKVTVYFRAHADLQETFPCQGRTKTDGLSVLEESPEGEISIGWRGPKVSGKQ